MILSYFTLIIVLNTKYDLILVGISANTPTRRGQVVEKLPRKNIIVSNEQKKKNEFGEALIGVLDESLAEKKKVQAVNQRLVHIQL